MKPLSPPLAIAAPLALAAGATAAMGFEPWNLWPLTLLATALLIALVDGSRGTGRAALLGWLFGTGHFALGLGWIATAFTYQAKMPAALGWVTVVLLAMFLALYIALAAGLTRATTRTPLSRVLALAAFWMLCEWLRGWVLSGFAWNPLGAAWLEAPGIPQLASVIGAPGLSGVMIVTAGGAWLLVAARRRLAGGALLLTGIAAAVAGSALVTPPAQPDQPKIFLVQPNIGQDVKYDEGAQDAHFQTYVGMTAQALAAAGTDRPGAIVLWSESAVPYAVEEEPLVRARLARMLGPDDLLLFGGVAVLRDATGAVTALTNSLFVLDARGAIRARYDKAHLVPLGEYVPARALMTALGVARLAPGELDFMPGPGPQTLPLPGFAAVGVQICYEIIFPGRVVDAANRPAWVANISNDAWFGPSGPPQHLAQARLRAIEEGLPIARATPTGISAMIDGHGRVGPSIGPGVQGVAVAALPPPLPPTLFARHGHAMPALFGLALLIAAIALDRLRRPATII